MMNIIKIQFLLIAFILPILNSGAQNTNISGAYLHTVVRCSNGSVYHTGDRNDNQAGTGGWEGTNNVVLTAVPGVGGVGTLTDIKAVDAGSTKHTVVLKNSGEVLVFGNNYNCQFGSGGTYPAQPYPGNPTPVIGIGGIGTLSGIKYIAGSSESTYAIRASDGALIGWGANNNGELGIGSLTTAECAPVLVGAPCDANVVQVDGGDNHAIALKSDGTVWAWGYNGINGSVGVGNLTGGTTYTSPQQVLVSAGVPLTGIVIVSAGDGNGYAIKDDGTLWAWGYNGVGCLGLGHCNNSAYAAQVITGSQGHASGFLQNVVQVVGGNAHAVVVTSDGFVYTMGSDQFGQLGDGVVGGADACAVGVSCKNAPYRVPTLSNIASVSEGDHWSFAVNSSGQAYAWGQNSQGQLGLGVQGTNVATPTAMTMPAGCTILPVELISFEAILEQDVVMLNWTSISEINSNEFQIERSVDGVNFSKVGAIASFGNSSDIRSYDFYDDAFSDFGSIIYYRLKMVDMDQSFSYSKTVVVNLHVEKVIIYPIPAAKEGALSVIYNTAEKFIQVQLIDVFGKVVFQNDGMNDNSDNIIKVPLQGICSGVYSLRMIFESKISDHKIVIQ